MTNDPLIHWSTNNNVLIIPKNNSSRYSSIRNILEYAKNNKQMIYSQRIYIPTPTTPLPKLHTPPIYHPYTKHTTPTTSTHHHSNTTHHISHTFQFKPHLTLTIHPTPIIPLTKHPNTTHHISSTFPPKPHTQHKPQTPP